ncbi:uncharacterized protein L3040_008223 [Drepanopeziza brunnea f. sp. 'multigermtubi']|uniref:uncharacterized protein n=1 Tax=Drepanopeziza brunnea f. sp. 'multigermtubi' TaxID=698441 RepID=UPI00238ECBFB|nr:hypothetical protein L3040_008223 [Drepanopeziza brunnea f. sp. 'multigermtubi']
MFGSKNSRRKRGSSNPPLNGTTANASATTAAAQAFLKNQASNASLSSAAAAAALRSRPTTPTSVADVQTKRTLRRSGSVSSVGSSLTGSTRSQSRPRLERRGSSGSMTERTFREPSPSAPVPSAIDAPPVPAIPSNVQQLPPSAPVVSHRRAASVEAPAMRALSPPSNPGNGRRSSLGPGATTTPPRKAGQRRLSNMSSLSEMSGPASRGANIARIVSPTNQNLVYDPNTRSFLPEAQVLAIEQNIQSVAQQPVKKKKRPPQTAGTHLAEGLATATGRPRGTFIDALEAAEQSKHVVPATPIAAPAPVPAPIPAPAPEIAAAAPPKNKKKKRVVVSDSESDAGTYVPNSDNESDSGAQQYNTRAGAMLVKRPSMVREDKEREEEEDDKPRQATSNLARLNTGSEPWDMSPSPPPRSMAGRGRGQASASGALVQERPQARSHSQPAPSPPSPGMGDTGLTSRGSVRGGRVASVSLMRTAHFATTQESLMVKHDPPERSSSPRKSALKHSSSPRGPSPNEGSSGIDEQASNDSGAQSEVLAPSRKRTNRVSFDETNVDVGQAATSVTTNSPVVLGPQTKRQWFSIGRSKKQETAEVDDDDSEIMKPRPALPSFGSVREKKIHAREVEERPLMKPASEAPPPGSPSLFTPPTGEVIQTQLGQSDDHNVGAVIFQDAASKNTANISKSREPLPAKVPSADGNGYHSGSDSSLYSVENGNVGLTRGNSVRRGPEDGDADTYRALASPIPHEPESQTSTDKGEFEAMAESEIPRIAILSATPTLETTEANREWLDMPGAWDRSNSYSGSQGGPDDNYHAIIEHHPTEPTPAEVGIAEPDLETPRAGSPVLGELAAYAAHPVILEEPEESDADVYSDAAEDFSDADDNGFMSLNAVADSPAPKTTTIPGLAISTPPDSPTTKQTKEKAYQRSQLSRKSSEPGMDQGWEKVQAYWSTLSAEKKRQLEDEAREEAEGSDTETDAKPVPASILKKKKRVTVQPVPVELESQRSIGNGRTYMITPGAKAGPGGHVPLRSSMRAEPSSSAEDPHIRKSMRGPGSMRASLRAETEHKEDLQKRVRPMSSSAVEGRRTGNGHLRTLSAASAAAAQDAATRDMTPKPIRPRSGSADSDSSFKRPGNRSNDIPSFRSSMRGSADNSSARRPGSPTRSSRFSIRSLSPTGSTFRRSFNPAPQANLPQTHMRNSMRSSYDTTPSMRNKPASSKGGFGRSAPAKTQQKPTRRLASRFADSSDEEDDRPVFKSRFDDSDDSDEDAPAPASFVGGRVRHSAPVRGISKGSGIENRDSSDLPDSDDEKSKITPKQNGNSNGAAPSQGTIQRSGSGRGTISLPAATDFPPTKSNSRQRSSFVSNILRRKKPDAASRVQKSNAESSARQETPLERKKSDLQALRVPEKESQVSSPRLQKRNPLSRENSGAWPLPTENQPMKTVDGGRPSTSDGGNGIVRVGDKLADLNLSPNGSDRPGVGTRRYTATGLSEVDISAVRLQGGARRKKKFGALRRMFRLDG